MNTASESESEAYSGNSGAMIQAPAWKILSPCGTSNTDYTHASAAVLPPSPQALQISFHPFQTQSKVSNNGTLGGNPIS